MNITFSRISDIASAAASAAPTTIQSCARRYQYGSSPARSPGEYNNIQRLVLFVLGLTVLTVFGTGATASTLRPLSMEQKKELQEQFEVTLQKRKAPVLRPDGTIQHVCGDDTLFCSAFRGPWAESLGQQGVYVGNLFANDLYLWDRFSDHHNVVRGHIPESFFIETHSGHKLAVAKALRGVSGAEYEAPAVPRFAERYLSQDGWSDSRHFLLSYELQKRFFVGEDQGRITKIRNLATQIEEMDPKFKPLRDATHNQISATLIPRLTDYPAGGSPIESTHSSQKSTS